MRGRVAKLLRRWARTESPENRALAYNTMKKTWGGFSQKQKSAIIKLIEKEN